MEAKPLIAAKTGWKRIVSGHPWLFRDDLVPPLPEEAEPSVSLHDSRGAFLGQGFFNPRSRIAFRLVCRDPGPLDQTFWRSRLENALAYRAGLEIDSDARRLVYSEADGFPGLIVDDYAGCLVVQVLTLGLERIREELISILVERLAPRSVILRNDSPVRALEGLTLEKTVAYGEAVREVTIREGRLRLGVDPLEGQKTGAYLDQRDSRLALRAHAGGRRVLDAFSYEGWFSLHLAQAGAREVIAMDSSAAALERLGAHLERNGLQGVRPVRENCFDGLKAFDRDEERFDLIVLDPPPFARKRADIGSALKAYQEINYRALRCLAPGGLLFTCCCSHGVSQDRFAGAVAAAAVKARRRLILLEQRLQPPDHPILFNEPESLYLKALLFRID